MKLPLCRVPDFKKQVEDMQKPKYYEALSEQDKQEFMRDEVGQRCQIWACETAASAYNIGVVIIVYLVITNGLQILGMVQAVAKKWLGIS